MDEEELLLYETLGNCAVENLFWRVCCLNNAVYATPLQAEAEKKLLSFDQTNETVLLSLFSQEEARQLIAAVANSNRLFLAFMGQLWQDEAQAAIIKRRWKENGRQIATLFHQLDSFWKIPEWSAMISHEIDLLETVARSLKTSAGSTFVNTVPLCQRLAVDMSTYTAKGVLWRQQTRW